jgi:electron transfer flavoprotein alpha subunit
VTRTILTLAEHEDDRLLRPSLEVLHAARRLADGSSGRVDVALVGTSAGSFQLDLASHGADRIHLFQHAALTEYATEVWARALTGLIEEIRPWAVLLSGTSLGCDVAPRVAAHLDRGLASECVRLWTGEDGALLGERSVYGGRVIETVSWREAPFLATLRAGAFAVGRPDPTRRAELVDHSVSTEARARVVDRVRAQEDAGRPDLSEARIVVAAGRGVGSAANLGLIEDLADALGAAVGSSRAVVDAGWLDHQKQIGQTGRAVTPDLYVACGISGAIQHLAGMNASRTVVAINRDAEAPIFSAADFGIVGDVLEIVPRLAAAVRALASQRD